MNLKILDSMSSNSCADKTKMSFLINLSFLKGQILGRLGGGDIATCNTIVLPNGTSRANVRTAFK